MPREDSCPSPEDLRLLLLGRTPDRDAGRLESHLEGCGLCLRAARALRAEDALVEAVRAQRGAEDRPEDEGVRALIERLQARRPADRGVAAPPADAPPVDGRSGATAEGFDPGAPPLPPSLERR